MNTEEKEQFINIATDRFFLESKNPLVNVCKRCLKEPTTKEEMKQTLKEETIA